MEWKPIKSAPWGKTILVKNEQMSEPVLATRGYAPDGIVHPDKDFFTTVFTPDKFFPTPSGNLVCPTVWRHQDSAAD